VRLSIIIPLYNSEKFLSRCLDSLLLHQDIDLNDYEILIINDGSTDNSLKLATTYAKKYANLLVYTQVNGGVGSARNKGISLAKGEYIYFIDPDDYLASNVLLILLNTAKDNELEILTFKTKTTTDTNLSSSNSAAVDTQKLEVYNGIDYIATHQYRNEVWWYIVKRSFINKTKIKFIEGRWMEDAILTAQLFLKANRMANLALDAHRYILVEGSAMTNKEPSHYLKVIDDNRNAAIIFESLLEDLITRNANPNCVARLRARQQSFVFFMMVRMLKSTIKLKEVKVIINELAKTNAYPICAFIGHDYEGFSYALLTKIFNNKPLFYLTFNICNPILKST